MTYYNSAKLVIVVSTLVLLFGSLPALGHADAGVQPDIVSGLLKIVQIQFSGLLVCTPTGNPPSTGTGGILGVAGAVLSGTCNSASGNLGMAITNTSGFFNGTLFLADAILFDPSSPETPCFLTVHLPLVGTACQVLPPTGILRAVVQLVNVINVVGGLVAVATTGPWVHAV